MNYELKHSNQLKYPSFLINLISKIYGNLSNFYYELFF
jgi:hypothetical protein